MTKPLLILAPMDDVTDTVFRQIIATLPYPTNLDAVQGSGEQATEVYDKYSKEAAEPITKHSAKSSSRVGGYADKQAGAIRRYGPDLMFTEFVNVDGLQSPGRPKLMHKLKLSDKEKPVIAQVWGLKPDNYHKTTIELKEIGFAGVDINMGCPVKIVIKNGACAALINNKELAGQIIDAVKEAAGSDFPVSVKTRVGFNSVDLSWIEFLLSKKLNMLTIHGRTAKQMSKVPADWDLIGEIVKLRDKISPDTLIVGNGDVESYDQATELANKYNLDGVMIGRGIFHDPFLFSPNSPWQTMTKEQKLELFKKHIRLHLDIYKAGERKFETLRKFCKVYINGFDGASDLRENFMQTKNPEQALDLLK